MDRASIIEAVQVRLDELSPFDDIEEVPAINYIDKLLDASTDTVFRVLPYHKLPLQYLSVKKSESTDPNDDTEDNTTKDDTIPTGVTAGIMPGEWVMKMPNNYIKFGEAQLSGWKRAVKKIADSNSEILQASKYTMGTPDKPVVVQRKWGGIERLHFFSSVEQPTSAKIHVVVSVLPEGCPDDLKDAIAWQCACDVLISLGKMDAAKVAQDKVLTHGI